METENTQTLSKNSTELIEAYLVLPKLEIRCPYYNNRRGKIRASLQALVGKGEPGEIASEAILFALREKIALDKLAPDMKKKFMVNHNLGIDCSGFAFHLLNTESKEKGLGSLRKKLSFPYKRGLRKLIALLRPVENCGVITFAHNSNSTVILLHEIHPGDIITMTHIKKNSRANEKKIKTEEIDPTSYNHIIIVEKVTRKESAVKTISYIHSIAWPTDGKYDHGVRRGEIEIIDQNQPIENQKWTENDVAGLENYTQERAKKSDSCQIRRLNWF